MPYLHGPFHFLLIWSGCLSYRIVFDLLNKSKERKAEMKLVNNFLKSKARRNFLAKWNREFVNEELKKHVKRVEKEESIKIN